MSTQLERSASQARDGSSNQTMTAFVYDDYGNADVLHCAKLPIPDRLPGQILIAVEASSVNPIDYRLRSGEMKGLLPFGFPRIPGYDVAGTVADCAPDAPFGRGDRVMAFLDHMRGGACAEFAVCAIDVAAKIPDSMQFADAAAIPLAGTTALQSLRDHGKIAAGKRVLINGASGGVGAFAVQIAKAYGAHVTAVASSDNESFCMELGADCFYDYEKVDFTKSVEHWDLIFDAAGKSGYFDSRDVLNEHGRYVSTEPDAKGMLMTLLTWPLSKSGKVMLAKPNAADLRELIRLHELGNLKVTIDRRYPMNQVADAHRRVEEGVDRGKVVLVNG
ncbi:NAD(P)-dependent alcohol dehydrogenase [Rubripirellula reticaptiva]|uniref:Zinc-type alcohol dehydrogenase-like protein n=1 Tax=Rubripirellula reticaptiva TaxID=2528013 RepID=A0A5C6EHR8_9BACT|nr:NAD(P)-dependent alcohol dehydrogenase [Rubripirellula reticaptiva]TWU48368.1 Zinc-type alcohol dehydrogenase-like protein [Rubripirellula reticaptiva]